MQKSFDLFIYKKILKIPNIRANYQKQFSINFNLECKQKPKTTFFGELLSGEYVISYQQHIHFKATSD